MIQFLCKTILHASPTHKLQCLQKYTSLISLKYFSSNANQHSFTVSYLINSCGLSLESALSASKFVHFETPHKPDSVLDFFQKRGFSRYHITNITKRFPKVLLCKPEKTILPKLEFFHSIGISSVDLATMLSLCPALLHSGLKNHIIPNFNSLSNLLQSSEKTIALIKGFPHILYHDVKYYLLPNVKILRDSGVPESKIVKFIDSFPKLFVTSPKIFEKKVAAVREMGINPLRTQFVLAIQAKLAMSESLWKRKLDLYKRWGLPEEKVLAVFKTYPWCMIASMEKIMEAFEFFVNEMGCTSSIISKRPNLIQLSKEKRIIPRGAVFQFLLSKGLIKREISIVQFFECSEETFMRRFVNSYDEAPQLLDLYNEKMNLSKKD